MQQAPGWFGKLGTLGDFATRRLPHEQVQALDGWLGRGMHASQAQLGDGWRDAYLSAPLWRFACAPGVFDAQWWFGVLMPSCDNVGRYFPLVVLQARPQPPQDRLALNHLQLWWQQVGDACLATLAEDRAQASLETFEDALDHTAPWPTPRAAPATPLPTGSGEGWLFPLAAHDDLADWMAQFAGQLTLARVAGHSLWWPLAGPQSTQPAAIRLLPGLPEGPAFVQMLQR